MNPIDPIKTVGRYMRNAFDAPESLDEFLERARQAGTTSVNVELQFYPDRQGCTGIARLTAEYMLELPLEERKYEEPREISPHTDPIGYSRGVMEVHMHTLTDAIIAAKKLVQNGLQVQINGDTVDVAIQQRDDFNTLLYFHNLLR